MFVLIAAIAMYDSRKGAFIGTLNDPGGIGSGFYPFWAAALMGLPALVLLVQAFTAVERPAKRVFDRRGAAAVLKLAVPMVAYALTLGWLGMYLGTALYLGFFARYIGRYHWVWVVAIAVLCPTALYLVFEQGFRLVLPKSILYGEVVPI